MSTYVKNLQYIAEKQAAVAEAALNQFLLEYQKLIQGEWDGDAYDLKMRAIAEQEKSRLASLRARVWICGVDGA